MVTKFIFLSLFLITSCGKDVNISMKQLESNSGLSDGNTLATNQEGVLKRANPDIIIASNRTYRVSMYSSYSALEFIAIRPINSQTPVKFRGKVKNNELVLEYLQAK